MRPQLTLAGDFNAQAKTALAPGDWYLGFKCAACGRGFAFLDDPTGTGDLSVGGDARIKIACPSCGAAGVYTAPEIAIFQSPTGGMTTQEEAI